MIMAGLEFMGEVPFRDIYITGLVRDLKGRKMSKSLGNGVDPLEIVSEFGADAMRFTLAFLAAQGQDVLVGKESFGVGSRFANKLWNASRYLLMNLEGRELLDPSCVELKEIDKWIFHRLNDTARVVADAYRNYRFNEAASASYEFFWSDFCDWYVESTKLSLKNGADAEKDRTVTLLVAVLEEALRLLHPLLPFITEEIYQKLPRRGTGGSGEGVGSSSDSGSGGAGRAAACITAAFPEYTQSRSYPKEAASYALFQNIVRAVRTLRSEFTIPPDKKIRAAVRLPGGEEESLGFLARHKELVKLLMGASEVSLGTEAPSQEGYLAAVGAGFEAFAFIRDVIDIPQERERLKKEIRKAQEYSAQTAKKLENQGFLSKARPEVVAEQRAKKEDSDRRAAKMREYLAGLGG
jgi:valyl-tRNA synthetase